MDVTSGTGPGKGARAKAKTASTTSKESAAKARARKPAAVPPAEMSESEAPAIDVIRMIATTAYFIAAERNFEPGHELDDWLEAERRVLKGS
jgi:hypothetical protein